MSNLSGKWCPTALVACLSSGLVVKNTLVTCERRFFKWRSYILLWEMLWQLFWSDEKKIQVLNFKRKLLAMSFSWLPTKRSFFGTSCCPMFLGTSKPPIGTNLWDSKKTWVKNSAMAWVDLDSNKNNTQSKSDPSIYLYKPKPWRIHECKPPITLSSWCHFSHGHDSLKPIREDCLTWWFPWKLHMFANLILIGSHLLTFVTATSDPDVIHVIRQPVIRRQGTSQGSLGFHYPQEQPGWTACVKMKKCVT